MPPHLDRWRLGFLVGVPLAWAVLLLFHPTPDPDDMYGSLRDDPDRWLLVHLGTLLFIGLLGAAVYLLVDGIPGTPAKVSRVAAGVFALGYGAGEAIQGVAVGVLVRYANEVPESERAGAAGAVQVLWDDPVSDDLAVTIGAIAWVVAVVAAAAAVRGAGASLTVSIPLLLSAVVVLHAPPIGPVGLLFFTAAVVLLARGRRPAPASVRTARR